MNQNNKCPICLGELDAQNRLITEDCGHTKCRQCFISEANGCNKCKQKATNPKIQSEINKTTIENKPEMKSTNIPKQKDEHNKTRGTTIPPHVTKEFKDGKVIYQCTICEKNFKSRTQQYYHMFCNNSSNKPFKCDECSKTFSTSGHLKYHIEGHLHRSFKCSICEKTFSKMQILQKHEKLHSAVPQECKECGAMLRSKEALNAHMMRHQNILPHKCDMCDKKFSLLTSLRTHQQIAHTDKNKFKCDRCDKVFNRNSSLKTHKLSHNQQIEYSCTECPKQFTNPKSLLRHSKIHIGKSKFKCTLCDTSSIRKDNILRHIRNMHQQNQHENCIEEIIDEFECPEYEEPIEATSGKELLETRDIPHDCEVPKTVPNSSVIRCIGNVTPVTICEEKQAATKPNEMQKPPEIHQAATVHKKLKKKYDPCEIYRKILLDDDSTHDNDTNTISGETTNLDNHRDETKLVQESTVICNWQQSNFTETHWRKNFKHFYQTQLD